MKWTHHSGGDGTYEVWSDNGLAVVSQWGIGDEDHAIAIASLPEIVKALEYVERLLLKHEINHIDHDTIEADAFDVISAALSRCRKIKW